MGHLDAASAVLAAIELDCFEITAQPALYAVLANDGPIVQSHLAAGKYRCDGFAKVRVAASGTTLV